MKRVSASVFSKPVMFSDKIANSAHNHEDAAAPGI
jgi:hypothetical protein